MTVKEYMEQVCTYSDNLKITYSTLYGAHILVDKNYDIVINESGDCNFTTWNKNWLFNNITEFNFARTEMLNVQDLFPNPQDFAKFYEKVRKEVSTWIVI